MNGEIADLLKLSEDDLFARLGETTTKGAGYQEIVERGKALFSNTVRNVSQRLCEDSRTKELYERRNEITIVDYIAALADIISGYLAGISPFVLAVLIVKNKLETVCAPYWKPGENGTSI